MQPKLLYLGLAISTPFASANLGNRRRALLPRHTADYLQARDYDAFEHDLYRREALAEALADYADTLYRRDLYGSADESDLLPALRRRTPGGSAPPPSEASATGPQATQEAVGVSGADATQNSGTNSQVASGGKTAWEVIKHTPNWVRIRKSGKTVEARNLSEDVYSAIRKWWEKESKNWEGYTLEKSRQSENTWRFILKGEAAPQHEPEMMMKAIGRAVGPILRQKMVWGRRRTKISGTDQTST